MSVILQHTKKVLGYDDEMSVSQKSSILYHKLSKNLKYAKISAIASKADPVVKGYNRHSTSEENIGKKKANHGYFVSHYWTIGNYLNDKMIGMFDIVLKHLVNEELDVLIVTSRDILPIVSEVTNPTGNMSKTNVVVSVELAALYYIAMTTPNKFTYSIDSQTTTGVFLHIDDDDVYANVVQNIEQINESVVKSVDYGKLRLELKASKYPRPPYWYCSFLKHKTGIHQALYGACVAAICVEQSLACGFHISMQHINGDRMILENANTTSVDMLYQIAKDRKMGELYQLMRDTNNRSYYLFGGKSGEYSMTMQELNTLLLHPSLDNMSGVLRYGLKEIHPFYNYILNFIIHNQYQMNTETIRAIRDMAQTLNYAAYKKAKKESPNDVSEKKASLIEELVSSLKYSASKVDFLDNLSTRTQRLGFSLPASSADVVEAILDDELDLEDTKKILNAFLVIRSPKSEENESKDDQVDPEEQQEADEESDAPEEV